MLKILIVVCLMLSSCSNMGIAIWNEASVSCPESDYDNGGNVKPMLGYCKSGKGIFLSYETKVN
jgi:hypothetical protein